MSSRHEPRTDAHPEVGLDAVRALLSGVVGDVASVQALDPDASLFDHLPGLDSIGCVNLVLGMEQRYGFEVDDEDVDEALFASINSLREFIETRLAGTRNVDPRNARPSP